jgi:transcriptional regulator
MQFSDHYPLTPFQITDFEKLKIVIERFPLATIISQRPDTPMVSQIPLILDEDNQNLLGHFDKNNPHCQDILKEEKIYCVFSGPNHYMSPEIYPDEQFPGWNYVSVHVTGTVKAITEHEKLEEILLNTTKYNEKPASKYGLKTS